MYAIDQHYLDLADFLRQNKDRLGIQSEVSQIDGAIRCAESEIISIAICGKSDSYFDYLFKLITDNAIEWHDILWSVPFRLVYAHEFSVKYLSGGEVKETASLFNIEKDQCDFIEISANIPLLCDKDLLFLTLTEGSEKEVFDEYLSSCDHVIICPNLSNAIGIEYNTLCSLIRDEWQQPERVRAIAIDINSLSLPNVMMGALSRNLKLEGVLEYRVITDLEDFTENQKNVTSLFAFEKNKEIVLERSFSSIDTACKKTDTCLQDFLSRKEGLENEIERFDDKISAFKAQAAIHIPGLGLMLDDDLKTHIFNTTFEYIRFLQGEICEEIGDLSKEEMEAYIPAYYSYLISEFVKRLSSIEIIPRIQKKFDAIIDDILDCYAQFFDENIPQELVEKTKIAKENFFSFVDKTAVDKSEIGIGLLEGAILSVIIYKNPIFFLFSSEIVQLTLAIKRGVISIFNRYIRSNESYAREISNRVNAVLDENLEKIPQQIEGVLFPALENNMRQALNNFTDVAAASPQIMLAEKQDELAEVQRLIKEIRNIKNNLEGLIRKY